MPRRRNFVDTVHVTKTRLRGHRVCHVEEIAWTPCMSLTQISNLLRPSSTYARKRILVFSALFVVIELVFILLPGLVEVLICSTMPN